MDLVAEGGRLISFGALSGRPVQVNAENLLFKNTTISAFWGARPEKKMTPAELGAARMDLVRRAAAGSLKTAHRRGVSARAGRRSRGGEQHQGRAGKIGLRP